MKKILLLLSFTLLCGCSVNYNLEISENDLLEKTTIMTDPSQKEMFNGEALVAALDKSRNYSEPIYFDSQNNNSYNNGIATNTKYYQIDNYQNANWQGLTATNKFDRDVFYRSQMVKYCFKELDYQSADNYIMLRTNNKCDAFDLYPLLENITINIKTDLNVIVSNADKVEDNVYTWVINRNNYQNKPIRLTYSLADRLDTEENPDIDKEESKEPNTEPVKAKKNNNGIIIVVGLLATLGLLVGVFIIKNKR